MRTARQRCWRADWVLDIDVKGYFDSIDWELLLKAVRRHTDLVGDRAHKAHELTGDWVMTIGGSFGADSTSSSRASDHRSGTEGAQRSQSMTLPKKRTYDFRIVDWQVFTPEEQERLYMQLLTSERLGVSDTVRKLILEEWPELAHKMAPK